jgi:DNA-binding GntR family transcriptional regulator
VSEGWASVLKITVINGHRGETAQRDHPPAGYRDHVTGELPEDVPRYQEIADSLRGRIDSGELPGGAMLPSAARISEEWGVSTTTAANALRLLHSESLIRIEEGGEAFVAGPDD